jgi:tRNA(Ile)-lysidine synthase
VALLWCMSRLAPAMGLRIGAAHLNHGLRGREADADAAFSAALADRWRLPFYVQQADVSAFRKAHGLGLEEAARILRYDFLSATALSEGFTKIALGHHADDNAELVLMNFIRGSGRTGLGGIPVKRPLEAPVVSGAAPVIIRPLMGLTKDQIFRFLESNHLSWQTDQSNRDTRHLRNRTRHELVPLLKRHYNPNIVEVLNRTALLAQREEAWINEILSPLFGQLLVREDEAQVSLCVSRLLEQPWPVAVRMVREALRLAKGDLRAVTFSHVTSVLDLCRSDRGHGQLDLPDRVRVERVRDTLRIFRSRQPLRDLPRPAPGSDGNSAAFFRLEAPGTAALGAFSLVMTARPLPGPAARAATREAGQLTAFFDMERITFPLVVRTVRPGDKFRPLGAGGTQKIKKFFIDHKVPLEKRLRCPLLESGGRIIWVMGHRIDERFKITDSTREALKVELTLAEFLEDV